MTTRPRHGETTEEWFDREIRPAMIKQIEQVRRDALAEGAAPLAAVRHWVRELSRGSRKWSPETLAVVQVHADELRGLIGEP